METVKTNAAKVDSLIEHIRRLGEIPPELEGASHSIVWKRSFDDLANAYLAIVAICHQTTPLGERALRGSVQGVKLRGWDYLKERFLEVASVNPELCSPRNWVSTTPAELSRLYSDSEEGLTLNRVSERAMLLNKLGQWLNDQGATHVREIYVKCGERFEGEFFSRLRRTEAYSDPVKKKALFFASIAASECGWPLSESLQSPVDYHELRGHLRIGTVEIVEDDLRLKVAAGLCIAPEEDALVRAAVQDVNDRIAAQCGLTSSVVHYLMWNVFRNCCPRPSLECHCTACSPSCQLPVQYTELAGYSGRCVFEPVCSSARQVTKVSDPAYAGHFY